MDINLFSFELPEANIALRPCVPRDGAKMLLVDPNQNLIADSNVLSLADQLNENDILVFNNTRVIPAQLKALRYRDDVEPLAIDITLHQRQSLNQWLVFAKPAKRLKIGDRLEFVPSNNTNNNSELSAFIKAKK